VLHNFIQINKVLHTFEIDGFVINTTFCKSMQEEFPKNPKHVLEKRKKLQGEFCETVCAYLIRA
jgi:hypothetical protein